MTPLTESLIVAGIVFPLVVVLRTVTVYVAVKFGTFNDANLVLAGIYGMAGVLFAIITAIIPFGGLFQFLLDYALLRQLYDLRMVMALFVLAVSGVLSFLVLVAVGTGIRTLI